MALKGAGVRWLQALSVVLFLNMSPVAAVGAAPAAG